jgi:hypothetical protein
MHPVSHTVPSQGRALTRLATIADSLELPWIGDEARSLAERVEEGRFFVACVGQFKRGKSTLLDALIGKPLLPTGVVPVTALPTVVRYGERLSARVRSRNGEWTEIEPADLIQYVSEEENPGNRKDIAGAEIFIPSGLLESGLCLVDTPGLGSVFSGNTQTTRDFIPHIDAAIVVLGADPPLSGDELALVEEVSRSVEDILFVLNKADRTSEQERNEATAFARRQLEPRLRRPVRFFEVSALRQLQGQPASFDWTELLNTLRSLTERSGRRLVEAAAARGLARLQKRVLTALREERETLIRPLEQSMHRIAALETTLRQAEDSLAELSLRLTAVQNRLLERFTDSRKAFLRSALPAAQEELAKRLAAVPARSGPAYRRAVLAVAQQIARERLLPWLEQEQREADSRFAQTAERFTAMGNAFLTEAAANGLSDPAELPEAVEVSQGLTERSHFYFHELIHEAQPASPFRFLADLVLGAVGAHRHIAGQAHEFLERLMEVNSSRVHGDLSDRLQTSRSRLEAELRRLLREVKVVAERAVARARAAREAGDATVELELRRLQSMEQEVASLTA